MKHKKLFALLTLSLIVATALCLVACEDKPISGAATVIVGEESYVVDYTQAQFTTKSTTLDAMQYLADNQQNFSFTCSFSGYGAFINSVSGLTLSGLNQYVALFVNDATYKDTSAYALLDKTVNGETFYYSGVGISSIKLVDGVKILFSVESF